jgi:itaconyl-CoA hydratase
MAVVEGWTGRYLEDFTVGDVYRHGLGRTVTDVDNAWFTMLTLNTNQMHFNQHYAEKSQFGKLLVNSAFTLALVAGMSVDDISRNAMANLGWTDIELPNPVFGGDTLYAESLVTDVRESKSRPNVGIVSVKTRGLNQRGEIVIRFNRTAMVYRRDAPQDKGLFPQTREPF